MSSTIRNPQTGFIDLDHDQLLVLDDRRGSRVEVLFGGVWLTEQNHPDDRFIEAGSALQIAERGRVVVEAIGRTGLRINAPERAGARRWNRLLGGLFGRRPALARHGAAALLALLISVGLTELTARGFQASGPTMHAAVASASAAAA